MKIFFDTNVYVAEALVGGAAEAMLSATANAAWRIDAIGIVSKSVFFEKPSPWPPEGIGAMAAPVNRAKTEGELHHLRQPPHRGSTLGADEWAAFTASSLVAVRQPCGCRREK